MNFEPCNDLNGHTHLGSSSSLHSEASNASGVSDGDIHSRISVRAVRLWASANHLETCNLGNLSAERGGDNHSKILTASGGNSTPFHRPKTEDVCHIHVQLWTSWSILTKEHLSNCILDISRRALRLVPCPWRKWGRTASRDPDPPVCHASGHGRVPNSPALQVMLRINEEPLQQETYYGPVLL